MIKEAIPMEQMNLFLESLRGFWLNLSAFLPRLIGALLLLIIGWLIAKMVRKWMIKGLKLVRLDVFAERAGIEDFLLRGGVSFTTVTLVANLIYWFILLTIILAVLNSLGLQAAAELFNKIILFIPNVIVAIVVLIFGTLFARFMQTISFTYLSNIGMSGAKAVSTVTYYAILLFAVFLALQQLSVGGEILVSAFQIAFGAICLALALAFGLGGRGLASHILEDIWEKSK
jgi:hypothetical protein